MADTELKPPPERIWLANHAKGSWEWNACWNVRQFSDGSGVEYVRADLAPSVVDARGAAERMKEKMLAEIPTSWLDPLLSGPDAIGGKPTDGCYVERLLSAVKARLSAVEIDHVTARDDSGWQPIETAPEDGGFLVYCADVELILAVFRFKGEPEFRSHATQGRRMLYRLPTHWMPLPKPPVTARSGGEGER